MNRFAITCATLAVAASFPLSAFAQVTVKDPWVRATVSQQKATGAFMQITSAQDARLVEARSPVAGVVEVHEMTMEKDVMKMRAVKGLDLPGGKSVELKPGGYHVMLMDPRQRAQAVRLRTRLDARRSGLNSAVFRRAGEGRSARQASDQRRRHSVKYGYPGMGRVY